jgi:hypothetical protein
MASIREHLVMNGLPPETSLDFFAGCQLTQVRVGEYEIILCFDKPVTLFMACEFSLDRGQRLSAAPETAATLFALLGKKVKGARQIGPGDIAIDFESGHTLGVFDSERYFESYHITLPDVAIVV